MPSDIVDAFKVGAKSVVVADCDLRGEIMLGAGTILQPRCTILAVSGPIIFGENNIVEENAVIVNRNKEPMVIGDNNLFEVGCRIEAQSIGSWNTFGIRSRIISSVQIGNHCVVGAGCLVQADPFSSPFAHAEPSSDARDSSELEPLGGAKPSQSARSQEEAASDQRSAQEASGPASAASSMRSTAVDRLPDYTHVFGGENRRRKAGEEGSGQSRALFIKHWEYLRETLPRYHPLKMF